MYRHNSAVVEAILSAERLIVSFQRAIREGRGAGGARPSFEWSHSDISFVCRLQRNESPSQDWKSLSFHVAFDFERIDSPRNLAIEAKGELGGLKNISKEVKEFIIGKLVVINELAFRLEEFRSRNIAELERKKAGKARELEATE
ncbi:hypothetical protein EVAR_22093_1 [Eumeta japonica]|uniref:Uncharacterized protein n=1 Tax=Eumeta variegata TaxID=151549 RepID=A0A4C1UTC2_EUMVA|nr:hypothetical protein EVAR_22093_1 [Eumeta japonica]